jgi:hypothetical protein
MTWFSTPHRHIASKQVPFQVMSLEKAPVCLSIRDERDGERTGRWSSPAGRLYAARLKVLYPSLRVSLPEGKKEIVGNLPPLRRPEL